MAHRAEPGEEAGTEPAAGGSAEARSFLTPEVPQPQETGDIVIDAALADLAGASAQDLDAQIAAGEHVHRTLQARLADLGGD